MNKKSISTLVLVLSTTASGFKTPPVVSKSRTVCLERQDRQDGSTVLGKCDESDNNKEQNKKILANGCAKGQAAIKAEMFEGQKKYDIHVYACQSPNIIQL